MISVVLPCRNEERALPSVIKEVRAALEDYDYEIIVSDSSTDRSPAIAEELGVTLVKHDKEGYGRAIKEGVAKAQGSRVLIADADSTYDFHDAPRLLEKDQDLVIGERSFTRENMGWLHQVGNTLLSLFSNVLFNVWIRDWHCGMRVIRRDAYERLDLQTEGMEFASEMIIKAIRNDLTIGQTTINYRKRRGESKLETWVDGWRHLRFLILNAPEKTLYPLAALFFSSFFFIQNRYYQILSLLVSFQFFSTGLYSEIYLHNFLGDEKYHIRKLYDYLNLPIGIGLGGAAIAGSFLIPSRFIQTATMLGGFHILTTVYYLSILGVK